MLIRNIQHCTNVLSKIRGCLVVHRSSISKFRSITGKPFAEIPAPRASIPFIGHLWRIRNNFNTELQNMFKETGSSIIKLNFLGSKVVFINDPSAAEAMYAAEGQFPKRGFEDNTRWFYKQRNEKTNFIFDAGPSWREGRSNLGKMLLPSNVYGYIPGFNRATDRLIRNIKQTKDDKGYVEEMQNLIMCWSLEVGVWFVLGVELDAMKEDLLTEAALLRECMHVYVDLMQKFAYALPTYKYFPSAFLRKANKAVDDLYKITGKYANNHFDQIMDGVKKGEKYNGQSLLEQWLLEGKLTKEEATHTACGLLSVGLDTTANLIAFMLYELSKHEEIQSKLHHQVTSVLGNQGIPEMESLQRISYLIEIIKEGSRMACVVPTHARQIAQGTTMLGYDIPAGTTVVYSLLSVSRNSKVYKDPHKFNPDRWSTDDISPYANIPFGVGPRSCWGRRFAEIEMKILLTKISQAFIMKSDESPDTPMPFEETVVLRPAKSLRIKFIERS